MQCPLSYEMGSQREGNVAEDWTGDERLLAHTYWTWQTDCKPLIQILTPCRYSSFDVPFICTLRDFACSSDVLIFKLWAQAFRCYDSFAARDMFGWATLHSFIAFIRAIDSLFVSYFTFINEAERCDCYEYFSLSESEGEQFLPVATPQERTCFELPQGADPNYTVVARLCLYAWFDWDAQWTHLASNEKD